MLLTAGGTTASAKASCQFAIKQWMERVEVPQARMVRNVSVRNGTVDGGV